MNSGPTLRAENLVFGYPSQPALLRDWSLSVHAGQMVAVVGPSGRGKSTLLYLLGLMLRPTSGEVVVDGSRVSGWPDHRRALLRATTFGFVFQDAALDPTRSVLDNVCEAVLYRGGRPRDSHQGARLLLERLGVQVDPARRPGQVSGGQAQRIAMARALLADPRIVLADEPTGNLDQTSADDVLTVLAERAHSGAAVVLVTHDPRAAARCDLEIAL